MNAFQRPTDRPLFDLKDDVQSLHAVLGEELVGQLIGHTGNLAARAGTVPKKPMVQQRLELLAEVVWCLQGSYNEFGIRRWFARPRQQLGGKAPAELLAGTWDAEADSAQAVLKLARTLLS